MNKALDETCHSTSRGCWLTKSVGLGLENDWKIDFRRAEKLNEFE